MSYFLKEALSLALLSMAFPLAAQVGFNNPNPDSTALIDMKSYDKGLLIPRMTTVDRTNMALKSKKPAHALLVFDTDQNMFFVYDTIANPDRWVALNPWRADSLTGNVTLRGTGKVGVGTAAPVERLHVNGNVKADTVKASTVSVAGNINSTGSLTTSGAITSGATVTASSFTGIGTVPIGGIIMWSGSTPPAGWALCNGQVVNGFATPDLRGRFIAGYDPADPDYSSPGSRSIKGIANGTTGGEKKHALSIAEMPRHNHIYYFFSPDRQYNEDSDGDTQVKAVTQAGTTDLTGGDTASNVPGPGIAHENRPPYYTLAYIMRIQ